MAAACWWFAPLLAATFYPGVEFFLANQCGVVLYRFDYRGPNVQIWTLEIN